MLRKVITWSCKVFRFLNRKYQILMGKQNLRTFDLLPSHPRLSDFFRNLSDKYTIFLKQFRILWHSSVLLMLIQDLFKTFCDSVQPSLESRSSLTFSDVQWNDFLLGLERKEPSFFKKINQCFSSFEERN